MSEVLRANDKFLVNRSNNSYQLEAIDTMAQIQDNDLMLVNRDGESYKITGRDVIDSVNPKRPPNILNVTVTDDNPGGTERFTDCGFTANLAMVEDGLPASSKSIRAYVEGELNTYPFNFSYYKRSAYRRSTACMGSICQPGSSTDTFWEISNENGSSNLEQNGGLAFAYNQPGNSWTNQTRIASSKYGSNTKVSNMTSSVNGALTTLNSGGIMLRSFDASGVTFGPDQQQVGMNFNQATWIRFVWMEHPGFLSQTTYVGDGTAARDIPHTLGQSDPTYVWIDPHIQQTGAAARLWTDDPDYMYLAFTPTNRVDNQDRKYFDPDNNTRSSIRIGGDDLVNKSGVTYTNVCYWRWR